VEVTEHDGALDLNAEVSGFEGNDLEIKLEPNRVTISGKRKTKVGPVGSTSDQGQRRFNYPKRRKNENRY
jgi:HSP20 family molecular chaperone IbpA